MALITKSYYNTLFSRSSFDLIDSLNVLVSDAWLTHLLRKNLEIFFYVKSNFIFKKNKSMIFIHRRNHFLK